LGCKVCCIEVHKLENALSVMSKQGTKIYRLNRIIENLKKENKNDRPKQISEVVPKEYGRANVGESDLPRQ
jgi:hypothetical protein